MRTRITARKALVISRLHFRALVLCQNCVILVYMKRTLITLTLAAMLISAAFATDMYCTKPAEQTTVCEFSDGRATVTGFDGTNYSHADYTASEWKANRALFMRKDGDKATYSTPLPEFAAPALPAYSGPAIPTTKSDCKKAQGKWSNNSCTVKGGR